MSIKDFVSFKQKRKKLPRDVCEGGYYVTGICYEISASSVMKRIPSQYVQGKAEGHRATVLFWGVW